MSPPKPKINTFLQRTSQPVVEPISKVFIIASLILGVNRLPLIGITNIVGIIIFMFTYPTFICVTFFYLATEWIPRPVLWLSVIIIDYIQYLLCTTLGFVLHKRLLNFYLNLNKFDNEIGINATKFSIRETVYNFLQLIVTLLQSATLYCLGIEHGFFVKLVQIIPIKMLNCFELHYYGHLFSLVIPRLKAISDCMKSSYHNVKNRKTPANSVENESTKKDKKPHWLHMKKLMDFYNDIIIVYDCLNEAIKWQMLIHLISTFSITLILLYNLVKTFIWGETDTRGMLLLSISLIVIQLCPLLVPCVFSDRVQREVRLFKDFLACRLYENTFDKPSRSTARTLLALIETRNLSFSLFHMFHIDMSLPFKFLALLITYLIILLQFDKVISPK